MSSTEIELLQFEEGEVVIYQNGNTFELGVVKKKLFNNTYFVNYHTGDTAALTDAYNLHKIKNAYAFTIYRKHWDEI